jgi:hypothetical protein
MNNQFLDRVNSVFVTSSRLLFFFDDTILPETERGQFFTVCLERENDNVIIECMTWNTCFGKLHTFALSRDRVHREKGKYVGALRKT